MKNMLKNSLVSFVFLGFILFSPAENFTLTITEGSLSVLDSQGNKIGEYSQGTVGKPVSVGASQFLLSFGRDVQSNLSAILSPVRNVNSPLDFKTANKAIKTDGNAIVTIKYSPDFKTATIDEGFIGKIQVADIGGSSSQGLKVADLIPSVNEPISGASLPSTEVKPTQQSTASSSEVVAVAPRTTATTENKDAFALLKNKGLFAFLDGNNAQYDLKHVPSTRKHMDSQRGALTSGSLSDEAKSKPISKNITISPERLLKASQDKPGEVRLVNIQGNVQVSGLPAQEGAIIPANAMVKTGDQSSAAAIIGGLHILTVHPNTEVSIAQTLADKKMQTIVDLKSGNVYADVNKREGMKQDFRVKTPAGTASATGSQALIGFIDGKLVVAAFESPWKGTDNNGKEVFNMRPLIANGADQVVAVSYSSSPQMSGADLEKLVDQVMSKIGGNLTNETQIPNFVSHNTASFVQGNATTLPNGATNPGATVEGQLRNFIASLITDGFKPGEKDDGWDINVKEVGFSGNTPIDPIFKEPFDSINIFNGRNGQVQPGDTTPIAR